MVDAQFGGIKKDTLKVIKSIPQRVCEKAMIFEMSGQRLPFSRKR